MRILILFLFLIVFPFSPLFAESGPLGFGNAAFEREMQTDRPDFTEGTQTIEPGHFQIESGYTFTYDKESGATREDHVFPEFLLRLGLLEDLEARVFWAGYESSELRVNGTQFEDVDGATDMSVGFKHSLYAEDRWRPELSMIGELGLPVGNSELSADEVEAVFKILWGYTLSEDMSLSGNVNFSALQGEVERYLEIGNSLSFGLAINEEFGCYLEYFGLYPAEEVVETTEHYGNGGVTYLLADDVQLDLRAGLGLNQAADDFFAGTGVTFRY